MGFLKEILLVGSYFLLLSTTLQSEDAYVFFYESQQGEADNQNSVSRIKQLIIYGIFSLIFYLTVLITPYLNMPIRKLSIGGCIIIMGKYACELATFTKIMINVFELAAIFMDIIGTAVFYLTSIRAVQILCQKYQNTDQSGKIFGIFTGIFGLSVVLGYAISYGCFKSIPLWAYLIVLACMTIVSGVICYFSFPIQRRTGPANQLQQQRQQAPRNQTNRQNQQANNQEGQRQRLDQVYRDNMTLGQVLKNTWFMYKKMLNIIPVQMLLGFFLSYSDSLIQYLVWTTQSESYDQRMTHNVDVIIIFAGGAILASLLVGIFCDYFSIRRIGYLVIILTTITLSFLYIGIFTKKFAATMLLYMFVGFSIFSLGIFLLCVSSKVFGGKFEAFAINAQFIGIASAMYEVTVIMFSGRISVQFRLCFQLAVLIISSLACIMFLKKLPTGQIDILFEQSQIDESQVTQRKPEVQIEMAQNNANKKIEQDFEKKDNQKSVDPDFLL